MSKFLFAAAAVGLIVAAAATAQNATPQQPPAERPVAQAAPLKVGQLPAAQAMRMSPVTAARLAVLEEELETLEAQRDVQKARIKAAEVAVKAAEMGTERVRILVPRGSATREEVERSALAGEAAKAQLDIQQAELHVFEVKIKYAKKRLDEAKAAGVRMAPGANPFRKVEPRVDPRPLDPPPAL
jgi:hypothetical protein